MSKTTNVINVTPEEVLNDIIIIYKKCGAINTNIYKDEGKYSLYIIRKLFGSFPNAIKQINIKDVKYIKYDKNKHLGKARSPHAKVSIEHRENQKNNRLKWHKSVSNKIFDFTKEDAKQLAFDIFNKNGEVTKDIFLDYSNYDKRTFLNMFNTFTNFLKEIGLYENMRIINNSKRGNKNNNFSSKEYKKVDIFTKEDAFKLARDIFEHEGKLTKSLFFKLTNYNKKIFLSIFNSFREFIKEAGLYEIIKKARNKTHHFKIKISKEELIAKIINCKNLCKDKFNADYLFSNTDITRAMVNLHFKSFNNMLKELGFKINMPTNVSDEELLNELSIIAKEFGTINIVILEQTAKYSSFIYRFRFGKIKEICKKLNVIYYNNKSSVSQIGLFCLHKISKIIKSKVQTEYTFDWLRNPLTNVKLRLDGYFEEYKLAIEYDGKQHFEFTPVFDKTYDKFLERQAKDRIKDEYCKNHEIKLLRIKYDEPLTEEHLRERLIEIGIIK